MNPSQEGFLFWKGLNNMSNKESAEEILHSKITTHPSDRLESFIYGGLLLMRSQRFREANTYYNNPTLADSVGLGFDRRVFLTSWFKDMERLTREIAAVCCFVIKEPIRLTKVFDPLPNRPRIIVGDVYVNTELKPPEEIYHDIALGYAEEWVHALQYLRGASLAGYEDDEVDVAAYLHRQKVPFTSYYLTHYADRRSSLWRAAGML